MLLVKDILKIKGNSVYTVEKGTTVIEALEMMAEKNVGALVVMEGPATAGIFSERDFIRAVANDKALLLKMPIETFMTKEVYSVCTSDTIDECMALMTQKHIRHLPVCEQDQLVGLISIGDVVKQTIEDKDLLITNMEDYILGRGYGK
jgi:CBS domain-containing protein